MTAPRQGLGTLFRALVEFVAQQGEAEEGGGQSAGATSVREQVRARVSPQTLALMDNPPSSLAWMDSTPIDELEAAVGEVLGDEALLDFGAKVSRLFGLGMMQPVIRAAFLLFGQSPAAVFANLDRFFTLATRGLSFRWTATGDGQGVVEARFDGPGTPHAAYIVLQGSLGFVYEISGTVGEISQPEVVESTAAGAIVRYLVRW
jgi:hypothetical protein